MRSVHSRRNRLSAGAANRAHWPHGWCQASKRVSSAVDGVYPADPTLITSPAKGLRQMVCAGRVPPGACLGSMRPAAVSPPSRLARVPARPLRQPTRCAAEHLRAAVRGATKFAAAAAAGARRLPGGSTWHCR